MIDIIELKGFSKEEILNVINGENSDHYEIYVPKSTQQFFSENSAVADDYAKAAFSGHKLSEISTNLEYEKVRADQHESILFEITTEEKDKLAAVLLILTYLYEINSDPEMEDSDIDYYYEELWQYVDNVENDKIVAVCPYFINLVSEFSEEDEG